MATTDADQKLGTGPGGTEGELLAAMFRVMRLLRRERQGAAAVLAEMLGVDPSEVDLGPRHIAVILHVAGHGSFSVSDLARRTCMGLPAVSLVVSDLSRLGLLARREDDSDHRRTIVSIAPEHRGMVARLLDDRLEPLRRAALTIGHDRVASVAAGLAELADALDSGDPDGDSHADLIAAKRPDRREKT